MLLPSWLFYAAMRHWHRWPRWMRLSARCLGLLWMPRGLYAWYDPRDYVGPRCAWAVARLFD